MAIYAQPANNILNYTQISSNLENGQTLVYDVSQGQFVNKKITVDLTGAVTSARNIGLENAIGIFNNKTHNGTLEFNNILAGPGITIDLDNNNNIVFTVDTTAATISVSENYSIIIDNDGNNPNAQFEIKTVTNTSATSIPINSIGLVSANGLFTGNVSGRGFIQSTTIDFTTYGFLPEMVIGIEDTPDQDGVYIIDEVVTTITSAGFISTLYFIDEFTGNEAFNLGGPKLPTLIKHGTAWIPDNNNQYGIGYSGDRLYSLQFWGVDFGPNGYDLQPGMIINVVGSELGIIDGTYLISQVIPQGPDPAIRWGGLIFDPSTPLPAGLEPGLVFDNDLCDNQMKIILNRYLRPTGFGVNTYGEVTATKIYVDTEPTALNELTNKEYVDNTITSAISNFQNSELIPIREQLIEIEEKLNKLKRINSKPLRYYLGHAKW